MVADTHANQGEDISSSPYACNALANARARHAMAEIDSLEPAFVVHLGDIVNPVPELPTYGAAADNFKQLSKVLRAPLHVVPGNHDVGDKQVSWVPAGAVTEEHLALYERHFGAHYFSFDHNDLHVVIVNAPIINSGLAAEAEQRAWLEHDLEAAKDRRCFVCIHYPPYVSNRDEADNYDNIDEPGRSWLLDLVERYRPEAMFCGHVHNFWYNVHGATEIYVLPSTAFVRHDYAEFYRGHPGDEYGRKDTAKLGYFVVRVYEHGHVADNVRTYGRTLAPDVAYAAPRSAAALPHTKESAVTTLGVDMRHPWAEEMEIAPSGALDEFERKRARNDYPLLALWEIGLRRMRVPLHDLLDPRVRRRMELLHAVGHLFQVHCYGLPDGNARRTLLEHAHLVDVFELVADWAAVDAVAAGATKLKADGGPKVLVSRVNRKDGGKHAGGRFNHLISHGFVFEEADELADLMARHPGIFDGVVLRVDRQTSPLDAARWASALGERLGIRACLYVKTSAASPAESFNDDAANATRVALAAVAALTSPGIDVILDTFADADRGYFARTGLVDRRLNPRHAGRVLRHLVGLMGTGGWSLGDGTLDGGTLARLIDPDGASHELTASRVDGALDLATGLRFDGTAPEATETGPYLAPA